MIDFFQDLPRYQFLQYALLTGLLSSIACGIVGTYVVARRISYIAGGIAHCVLGGMGAARYMQVVHDWTFFTPMIGAVLAALVAAALIGLVSLRAREREDTVISALWAIGMAVGFLFIHKTPGYEQNLPSYLFGSILLVDQTNLWLITILDAVVVVVGLVFYNHLLAVCFDEEFARLRGVPVDLFYFLLLGLTALTVVLMVWVVGIVLVIALLSLPVAVAGRISNSLIQMMIWSALFCALFTTGGLVAGYGLDWPAGATTILLAASVYLVVFIGRWAWDARRRARA